MLKRVQTVANPQSGEDFLRRKTSENGSNSELSQNTKKILGEKVVAAYFKTERLRNPLTFKPSKVNDKQVSYTAQKPVKSSTVHQPPLASEAPQIPLLPASQSGKPGAAQKPQPALPPKQKNIKESVNDGSWDRLLDPNQSWISVQRVQGRLDVETLLTLEAAPPSVQEQNAKRLLFENKQLKEIKKIEKPPVKSKKQYQSRYKVEPVEFRPGSAPGQFKVPPSVQRFKDEHSGNERLEEDDIDETPKNILSNHLNQNAAEYKVQNAKTMKRPLVGAESGGRRRSAFGRETVRQK